jgi:MFS family permease
MKRTQSFWKPEFIIALLGFFFLFMSITLFFIFPLFFEPFGASRSRIGWIMGIHSLSAIFIRPLFGRLIDIRGRKKTSLAGIAFLILVLPFFHLIKDAGTLPLVLRALTGLGWGISMTATMTICSDLVPVNRLAQSMGIIGVAGLVSVALGPFVGEEIVRLFGFSGLFNVSLVFLIFSFGCILLTKETVKPNDKGPPHSSPFKQNIGVLALLLVASLPIAHGAVRGSVVNFIALFGKSIPFDRIGPFFIAFSVAAIATRFFLGALSDKHGRKQVLFPAVCLISLNLVIISQVKSFWLFVITGFIGGFGQGLIFPALSTYIIDIFGRQNKGLAISLYQTFFDVGMGLGSALFGFISDLTDYRQMYLSAAVLFFFFGAVFTWKAPSTRREKA